MAEDLAKIKSRPEEVDFTSPYVKHVRERYEREEKEAELVRYEHVPLLDFSRHKDLFLSGQIKIDPAMLPAQLDLDSLREEDEDDLLFWLESTTPPYHGLVELFYTIVHNGQATAKSRLIHKLFFRLKSQMLGNSTIARIFMRYIDLCPDDVALVNIRGGQPEAASSLTSKTYNFRDKIIFDNLVLDFGVWDNSICDLMSMAEMPGMDINKLVNQLISNKRYHFSLTPVLFDLVQSDRVVIDRLDLLRSELHSSGIQIQDWLDHYDVYKHFLGFDFGTKLINQILAERPGSDSLMRIILADPDFGPDDFKEFKFRIGETRLFLDFTKELVAAGLYKAQELMDDIVTHDKLSACHKLDQLLLIDGYDKAGFVDQLLSDKINYPIIARHLSSILALPELDHESIVFSLLQGDNVRDVLVQNLGLFLSFPHLDKVGIEEIIFSGTEIKSAKQAESDERKEKFYLAHDLTTALADVSKLKGVPKELLEKIVYYFLEADTHAIVLINKLPELEKLGILDMDKLFNNILEQVNWQILLTRLDRIFGLRSIDQAKLIDGLFEDLDFTDLDVYFHHFANLDGIDLLELANRIITHNSSDSAIICSLARSSHFLISKGVTIPGFASLLVDEIGSSVYRLLGDMSDLCMIDKDFDINNYVKFLIELNHDRDLQHDWVRLWYIAGLDQQGLVDYLFKGTGQWSLVEHMELLLNSNVVIPEKLLWHYSFRKDVHLSARHIVQFYPLMEESAKQALQIDPVRALFEERYDQVYFWMKINIDLGRSELNEGFLLEENCYKQYKILLRDGRFESANYLLGCMALCGYDTSNLTKVSEADRQRQLEHDDSEEIFIHQKIKRMEGFRNIHEEVALFYMINSLMSLADRLERLQLWQDSAKAGDVIYIRDLKKQIEEMVLNIKAKVGTYICRALNGELEEVFGVLQRQKNFHSTYFSDKYKYRYRVSKGELLDMLASAKAALSSTSWKTFFAGPVWGRVAEAAYSLYATADPRPVGAALDVIFDLQHNSGSIFNKSNLVFDFDEYNLKKVLDTKFAAADVRELWSKFGELGLADGAELDLWRQDLNKLEAMVARYSGSSGVNEIDVDRLKQRFGVTS